MEQFIKGARIFRLTISTLWRCLSEMKRVIMASATLIAMCAVSIVFIRSHISRREWNRYDETVAILNGLTMVSEERLTNVCHDAWGHEMRVEREGTCWTIVSLGHDPVDPSDDVVMKWNPRLGQLSIDFKYDGQMNSYSMCEECETLAEEATGGKAERQ